MSTQEPSFSYSESQTVRLCRIWLLMHQRCYLPTHRAYPTYGERGITICEEWLDNFEPFRKWAMSAGYNNTLQIDRIDNAKGYSPDNCRCVTPAENHRNKSTNVHITAFGETRIATDWVSDPRCSISHAQLIKRVKAGMNTEEAITKRALQDCFRNDVERECLGCGKIKPRSEFYLSSQPTNETHHSHCKECEAETTHNQRGFKKYYQRLYKGPTDRECGRCRKIKLNGEFPPLRKREPQSLSAWCRECHKEYRKSKTKDSRECLGCGTVKPRSQFSLAGREGNEPHRSHCKDCEARYAHEHGNCQRSYQRLYKGKTERECGDCHKIKPNDQYYIITTKQGARVPYSRCIECTKRVYHDKTAQAKNGI